MDPNNTVASAALWATSAFATVAAPLDVVVAATSACTPDHTAPGATATAAAASAQAVGLLPNILYGELGLPGYPTSMGDLSAPAAPGPSPCPASPGSAPGFTAPRLPIADNTWAPPRVVAPSTDSALVAAIVTIQAALSASQEHERAVSRALEEEHAMGAALTAQMATTQRLIRGRPPVIPETPPLTLEAPIASGLDADHIAAQVVGLHNIRSLVSIVLDPTSSHYPRWRGQVLLTLQCYALADHVLDDIVAPSSSTWSLMDTVVLSWLHGTITVELQDIIRDQANTGRQAWLPLEEQFLGNQDARALHLDAHFHQFSQGDLSVGEYCRQMKGLADCLCDLGEPVADRTLVPNLLRGLSPRYGLLKALIKRTVPFPTFHAVRNELLLEELTMTIEVPTPAPALYTAIHGAQASFEGHAPALRRPRLPLGPLPRPLRPLVRLPPSTAVVATSRAYMGSAPPPVGVRPAGVATTAGHRSTTPRPAPSPCGRARPPVPPVLLRQHPLS
jgi:hypothetical protein